MAMMSSSIWFFCIFLTSLTGSIAYGLWKILEHVLQQKRKYSWLFLSSKLVILFWIVPFVFLQVTFHAYDYWNHTWKSDVFSISPVFYWILGILFYIWLAGFLWNLILYIRDRIFLRRLKRNSIYPSISIVNTVMRMKQLLNFKGRVRVYTSLTCSIPQVSGLFLPTILLPDSMKETHEIEIVAGHELMHIKHGDLMWKYFLAWMKRIHWFNPILTFLFRDISEWNEIHCDRDLCRKENALFTFEEYFGVIIKNAAEKSKWNDFFVSSFLNENQKSVERRMRKLKHYHFGREIRKWGVCLLSILFLGMVSIVSYAAGETILSGYGMLTDATGVLIEEAPTIEPELEEEIIQAGEESHVLEIEMPIESEKGFQNWDIPVNALYMTPNFYCSASQKVDVLVYISPTDQLTRVGIMEPDGTRRAVSSEGRINHTFSVNQSGNYRVYIENQSDVPISVEFYFNVY